jgi:hypothetical protein
VQPIYVRVVRCSSCGRYSCLDRELYQAIRSDLPSAPNAYLLCDGCSALGRYELEAPGVIYVHNPKAELLMHRAFRIEGQCLQCSKGPAIFALKMSHVEVENAIFDLSRAAHSVQVTCANRHLLNQPISAGTYKELTKD